MLYMAHEIETINGLITKTTQLDGRRLNQPSTKIILYCTTKILKITTPFNIE